MKVTGEQVIAMFLILKESCKIAGGFAGISNQKRHNLLNEIINQQGSVKGKVLGFRGVSDF